MDRENEVTKKYIYYIPFVCLKGSRRFPFVSKRFKFLKQVERKTSQFQIVCKSLARFSTQFRVKEVLNFYLLHK